MDPPASQEYYLERLACLGDGLTCYAPLKGLPEPGVLPAKRQGGFTFGSFNASPKINPVTIALWARALHSVKNSRLMLKFSGGDDAGIRQRFLDRFARRGIAPERIVMHGWMPQSDHFALYDQVDVALDTFPYNGGITTLESLWMGVPVLPMWGDTAISRVGLDLLGRLDMSFLVAGHARCVCRQGRLSGQESGCPAKDPPGPANTDARQPALRCAALWQAGGRAL